MRGKARSVEISTLRLALVGVVSLLLLFSAAVYTGTRLVNNEIGSLGDWRSLITGQQAEIAAIRRDAETELDALTLRIGKMQAQMLRLNALGERLVRQADLDRSEFNFDAIPALGGSGEMLNAQSVRLPDFLAMLDQLDSDLEGR